MITGVIAPLAAEYRTARALRGPGCRVVHAGVGLARAQAAAEALLAAGARRLLVWGTAGALEAGLRPGCLVLPEFVRDAEGRAYPLDPDWMSTIAGAVPRGVSTSKVPVVSVGTPVVTQAQKRALARASGAGAVDMETAAIAGVAEKRGIPCAVLRAIADPLELDLPGVVLAARGDRLLPLEIPARLLLRPKETPAIRELARAFSMARKSLDSTAAELACAMRQA